MRSKRSLSLGAKQAMIAANKYILFNYPTMYTGALPRRLTLPKLDVWAVPIVLTHPDHGVVGDVGLVAIDVVSGEVVGATPRREVVAPGKGLREAARAREANGLITGFGDT